MGESDLEKILKIIALLQQGIVEVANFIQNKQAQGGKTTNEIFAHAEKANAEAKNLIDSL